MVLLGKYQNLKVMRTAPAGVYVGDEEEQILLPKKQVPEGTQIGDVINVFAYRDSEDRKIATVNHPLITLGQVEMLTVKEVSKNGAFLDWGLEKDLFLPFKEQTKKVAAGERYLCALYLDKSERLCATMNVYDFLEAGAPYVKDDMVSGIVYNYNPEYGAFVAIDNLYHGMLIKRELHRNVSIGEMIEARVVSVREDGKLDLSLQKKAYLQMEEDAAKIYKIIEEMGGTLPYTDKASPEQIRKDFAMSKNEFKRGIGRLLKETKVVISKNAIKLTK